MSPELIDEWSTFFETLALLAAALLGLVFVLFGIRWEQWEGRFYRKTAALLALGELSAPMFFGLFFLMPGHHWHVGGLVVGVLGWALLSVHAGSVLCAYFGPKRDELHWTDKLQGWLDFIPVLTFGVLGFAPLLSWRGYICIWFLASGLTEAWFFLRDPDDKPLPAPTAGIVSATDVLPPPADARPAGGGRPRPRR